MPRRQGYPQTQLATDERQTPINSVGPRPGALSPGMVKQTRDAANRPLSLL
jgi:hypothetical protein